MKQYCRYCSHLVTGNGIVCEKLNKEMSEAAAKTPNRCKSFEAYDGPVECQDAFGENVKGYHPREQGQRMKECKGQICVGYCNKLFSMEIMELHY